MIDLKSIIRDNSEGLLEKIQKDAKDFKQSGKSTDAFIANVVAEYSQTNIKILVEYHKALQSELAKHGIEI